MVDQTPDPMILQAQGGHLNASLPDGLLAPENECRIPPAGWYCTRGAGHDGPCAAFALPPTSQSDIYALVQELHDASYAEGCASGDVPTPETVERGERASRARVALLAAFEAPQPARGAGETAAQIARAVLGPPGPDDVLCYCGAIGAGLDDECICTETEGERAARALATSSAPLLPTERDTLREKAAAAQSAQGFGYPAALSELHAAAPPSAILSLLDERDELRSTLTRIEGERDAARQIVEDALLAMREPMTLADARAGRDVLTKAYHQWQCERAAAARAAQPGRDLGTPTTGEER